MGEKKQSKKNSNDTNNQTNGVMITVYVESSATRSRKQLDSTKKSKPRPQLKRLRTSQSQGYDSRALLLAYSRQLRNAGPESQDVQVPITQNSRHKSKEEHCSLFQFCRPSSQMLRRSYDRVPFVEKEVLNQSGKKKSNEKISSTFLRKLKGVLREMSCKNIKL